MSWIRAQATKTPNSHGGTTPGIVPLANASRKPSGRSPSHLAPSPSPPRRPHPGRQAHQDRQGRQVTASLDSQGHPDHQGRQAQAGAVEGIRACRACQDHQDLQVCPHPLVRRELQERQASTGRTAQQGQQDHQAMRPSGHQGGRGPPALGANRALAVWTAAMAPLDRQDLLEHGEARRPLKRPAMLKSTLSGTMLC